MITLRSSDERGLADHGWLKSYHTFSFGDYYDPAHMGFKTLRVINEDRVGPGKGFGTHGHRDMEILSYVIAGELAHQDSMGNKKKIVQAGDVQGMSAGTGITHSEFNPSDSQMVHFLQIWIRPRSAGLPPAYGEWKPVSYEERPIQLVAASDGRENSIRINQDAEMWVGWHGVPQTIDLAPFNSAWLQLIEGSIKVGELLVQAGDGLQIESESSITVSPESKARYLLFKL